MPRIAAFFAAVVLTVGSIGVNMVRYPVVWDMVGASPCLSASGQAAPAKAAALPTVTTASAASSPLAAAAKAAGKKPGPPGPSQPSQDRPGDAQKPLADRLATGTGQGAKPRGEDGGSNASGNGPLHVKSVALERDRQPSPRPASPGMGKKRGGGKAGSPKPPATKPAENFRPQSPPHETTARRAAPTPENGQALVPVVYPDSRSTAATPQELPVGMCRLPPLSDVNPPPPDHLSPPAPGEAFPRYPATGM